MRGFPPLETTLAASLKNSPGQFHAKMKATCMLWLWSLLLSAVAADQSVWLGDLVGIYYADGTRGSYMYTDYLLTGGS